MIEELTALQDAQNKTTNAGIRLRALGRERRDALSAHTRAVEDLNQRIVALASEARDAGLSAAQIASALGISRARLYQLVGKAGERDE